MQVAAPLALAMALSEVALVDIWSLFNSVPDSLDILTKIGGALVKSHDIAAVVGERE